MTSISFRHVLVSCVLAALLGFALPNVMSFATDVRVAEATGTVLPAPAEAEPLQQSSCGDGRCGPPEDCNTCPRDCGSCCGDHRCAPPEDCRSCPSDCGGC